MTPLFIPDWIYFLCKEGLPVRIWREYVEESLWAWWLYNVKAEDYSI